MDSFLNPTAMLGIFAAVIGFIVLYEIGRLMGARQASKIWTAVTGISLEELEARTFKNQLDHLQDAIKRTRKAH
jgi:membrane protein DedA with SNARE-associated domain